jgi:hypothetical protein
VKYLSLSDAAVLQLLSRQKPVAQGSFIMNIGPMRMFCFLTFIYL